MERGLVKGLGDLEFGLRIAEVRISGVAGFFGEGRVIWSLEDC